MTDCEMLEMAAKAAGCSLYIGPDGGTYIGDPMRRWDPLNNDGDALRLAVELNIFFRTDCIVEMQEARDDIAATRRAIVRAAAAIGESMP